MKQVLIITSSIGNGHMTAAKNTETMLNKLYGDRINCHVVDIVEYLSKTLNVTSRSLYNASLKISPNLYKIPTSEKKYPKTDRLDKTRHNSFNLSHT
jgi:hypothetical protein